MRDSHREIYCEAREHAHVLSLEVKTGFHCFFLVHLILLFKKKKHTVIKEKAQCL